MMNWLRELWPRLSEGGVVPGSEQKELPPDMYPAVEPVGFTLREIDARIRGLVRSKGIIMKSDQETFRDGYMHGIGDFAPWGYYRK